MKTKNGRIRWIPNADFRAKAERGGLQLPHTLTGGVAGTDELGPYVHFAAPGIRVAVQGKRDLGKLWAAAMLDSPPAA